MKLRRSIIAFSAVAVTINLTVAVHADSSSSVGQVTSQNFQSSGFRSHGYPVNPGQDQGQTSGTPATYTDQLSPLADQSNGDYTWLHNFFNNFRQKPPTGKFYVVGSPSPKPPISCHYACITATGTISLIPVWVGNWAGADIATWNSVLGNIVTSLGTASANSVALTGHVFNTNTLYYTSQGLTPPSLQWVPNVSVTATTDPNGQETDADVANDINTFISANPTIVPAGTTPVYLYIGANSTLLTSGFGTTYCGWHTYGTTSTLTNVPYIAFQNFTSQYNSACSAQTTSPNGNIALDAMASVMVHEVDEVLTDPYFMAWYDSNGAESADKCAWTFGTTYLTGSGRYNVQLGSIKYLIQQDWLENNLVTMAGRANGTACSVTG
ncbi:MAG TPA: hypothetical protein VIH79_02460 [Candidatus Nanopelagicaceae bacterium]